MPAVTTDGFPRKFGKYHLLMPLAQGGMGALYLAVAGDKGLEKLCVIKTVLPHLADAEYVQRFRDEAKVVVKLSHGNLVPVFDAGQVGGEIFLAMDFVEGKDLRAVWNRCAKKGVAFPVDVAVYIVKELCRGLAYAHGFGELKLVHRDVSPPNVLISFAGEVKLTDFGLANSTLKVEKTAPGVIYGKVSYMSPEQARGEGLDGRTDLYAAGIVLWELLTGRQLFPPGESQPQDLVLRARNPKVDPPSKRAPRVPHRLDDIVLKALAADRGERYQNGEEMRAALAGWLAAEAPATDSARLEKFVSQLFVDDIPRERADRESMIEMTRERIRTGQEGQPVRSPHRSQRTKKGAAPVPEPGPGGATFVQSDGSSAAAVVAQSDSGDYSADIVGQVLDGRYAVRSLIGEGGMGRVYEAEHVEIGKRVAIKVLHPAYSRTPEVVARFRREARAASKIGHPNIVDVTDSGTTSDGSVYFVMEFLEGVELATVIERDGALDVVRTLNVATQICRALAAAHNAGIIHRDLKPENIFLIVREGTTDFVKVLDFGIAKSAELEEHRKERLTHPGMAMGTPEYMAPEQAAGRPADARSDVYALAAILYEMVTGVAPYIGDNFMEILTKKATVEPVVPRQLRVDLPESVERVIMRALARDPAQRPPSMEAFEYELTKCLAGRGVAVAKMLGMPVDPALMMGDSVVSSPTPQPMLISPMLAAAPTPDPRPTPQDQSARLPFEGLAALGPDLEDVSEPTAVVLHNRRSLRMGLFYAVAAVVIAGGIIGYVAQRSELGGSRPQKTDAKRSAFQTASAAPSEPVVVGPPTEPPPPRPVAAKPEPPPPPKEEPKPEAVLPERPVSEDRVLPPKSKREADRILDDAERAKDADNVAKARTLYSRLARGNVRNADGYLGIASLAFQNNDWDETEQFAQMALEAGAGDKARILLGHALLKKGRTEEAVREYKLVLRNNPKNTEVKKALAKALQ